MLQIYNAILETVGRLAQDYGRQAAVGILLFLAAGTALRLVGRVLPRGGPPREGDDF
jgi:hypothetical protein